METEQTNKIEVKYETESYEVTSNKKVSKYEDKKEDEIKQIKTRDKIILDITGKSVNGELTCVTEVPLLMKEGRKECNVYLESFCVDVKEDYNIITDVNDNFTYITTDNKVKTIIIPQGKYRMNDIISLIEKQLCTNGDYIDLKKTVISNNEFKEIICGKRTFIALFIDGNHYDEIELNLFNKYKVDFTPSNSIGKTMGFKSKIYSENAITHYDKKFDSKISDINICCNLTKHNAEGFNNYLFGFDYFFCLSVLHLKSFFI